MRIAGARRTAGLAAAGVALVALTAIGAAAQGRGIRPLEHPVLPIGSDLPPFTLPGVDGRTHSSDEFTHTKLLAIVFESNHCPVSQLYEGRIEQLYKDYRGKGVTLVAINPNNAKAVRLDELGYTDVTDSLPEMKIRAAFRGIMWPYLYDGETQELSMKFGAVATPHIFIFDEHHKLAYQGRIDDNQREDLVKSHDARNALDALLAGKPVPVANTRAFGCTTKWMYKSQDVAEEWARIQAEPVTVTAATADDLKALRGNATDKVTVVDFWSTACKACQDQLVDFETTYRMYRLRAFNLVTVSTDAPDRQADVLAFLKQQHASSTNRQFASADRAALQAAWGATWNPAEPYVVVLAPGGEVLYQKAGKIDVLSVRRVVLANMPDMRAYIGQKAYWMAAVAADRAKHR
jgi:peroxiredoxin